MDVAPLATVTIPPCVFSTSVSSVLLIKLIKSIQKSSEQWLKLSVNICGLNLLAVNFGKAVQINVDHPRGSQVFPRPAVKVRRSREGPLAASEREEESVEVFGCSLGAFLWRWGWKGRRSPVPRGPLGYHSRRRAGRGQGEGGCTEEPSRKNTSSNRV